MGNNYAADCQDGLHLGHYAASLQFTYYPSQYWPKYWVKVSQSTQHKCTPVGPKDNTEKI